MRSRRVALGGLIMLTAAVVAATAFVLAHEEKATAAGLSFYTVSPCRAFDTREATGPTAGQPISNPGGPYNFRIQGNCGVPYGVSSVALNVTVVNPTAAGDLRLYPAGQQLLVSTLNFKAGGALANNSVATLATISSSSENDLTIASGMVGSTHAIVDVLGYFLASGTGATGGTGGAPPTTKSLECYRTSGGSVSGLYSEGGTTHSFSCPTTVSIPIGLSVALSASPSSGYSFTGWSGSCTGSATTCTITMDSDKTVFANFGGGTGGTGGAGATPL